MMSFTSPCENKNRSRRVNDLPARIAKLSPGQRELLWRELNKQSAGKRLPDAQTQETPGMAAEQGVVGSSSPLEEVLAAIWEYRLQRAKIDISQPFGDLGGDSDLAAAILADIQRLLALSRPFKGLSPEATVR